MKEFTLSQSKMREVRLFSAVQGYAVRLIRISDWPVPYVHMCTVIDRHPIQGVSQPYALCCPQQAPRAPATVNVTHNRQMNERIK